MAHRRLHFIAASIALGVAVAACGSEDGVATGSLDAVSVTIDDDACTVAFTSAPAGEITFDVTNDGATASRFVVRETGGEVIGDLKDIAADTTEALRLDLHEGQYETECGLEGAAKVVAFVVTAD